MVMVTLLVLLVDLLKVVLGMPPARQVVGAKEVLLVLLVLLVPLAEVELVAGRWSDSSRGAWQRSGQPLLQGRRVGARLQVELLLLLLLLLRVKLLPPLSAQLGRRRPHCLGPPCGRRRLPAAAASNRGRSCRGGGGVRRRRRRAGCRPGPGRVRRSTALLLLLLEKELLLELQRELTMNELRTFLTNT